MAEFSKKHPQLAAELQTLIESGMNPDQLIQHFKEKDESKEGDDGSTDAPELFPDEIRMISQAFAYREPASDDIKGVYDLLNAAYMDELNGPESFRVSRTKESVSLETIQYLFADSSYQWLVMENPSEDSDAMIGACCFSTDGVSRRNGELEGALGSIRFFGIMPRYRGLCVGKRLLDKVEDIMFNKSKCCRAMICLPSTRTNLLAWVQRKNYVSVGSTPYPAKSIGHILKPDIDAVELVQFIKCKTSLHSGDDTADDKEKKILALAEPNHDASTSQVSGEVESPSELESKTSTSGTELDASDDKNATLGQSNGSQSHLPPLWRNVLPVVLSGNSDRENCSSTGEVASSIDQMTIDSVGENKGSGVSPDNTDSMRKQHPKAATKQPRWMQASELTIHENFESNTPGEDRVDEDEMGVD